MNRPALTPLPADVQRPLWSVMVPAYDCARTLRQTLSSVLAQDPGPELMQIEVVDDASPQCDLAPLVKELGGNRVSYFRQPQNIGVTRNFNTCLERSRGHLIHLLHGDDWVAPEFYATLSTLARSHPDVALFSCRSFLTNDAGEINHLSPAASELLTPTRNAQSLYYANLLPAPGVVVRRSFYECTGGYDSTLPHTADWEMWVRAIAHGGGCWLNQPLSYYRIHAQSDTNRLAQTAQNLREQLTLSQSFSERYPDFDRNRFRIHLMELALIQSSLFYEKKNEEARRANESFWSELATPREKILRRYQRLGHYHQQLGHRLNALLQRITGS